MSDVRRPRPIVTVNGISTLACVEAHISSARSLEAASFRLRLDVQQLQRDLGMSWCAQNNNRVEVSLVMLDPVTGATVGSNALITGTIDAIIFDPASASLVVKGRDRAAALIDRPLVASYLNQTSSEIAETLGAECGLSVVSQPTATMVGQYYQIQRTKNSLASYSRHGSVWDLLVELAGYEKYDLWVDGNVLNFLPTGSNSVVFPVAYDPQSNQYLSKAVDISALQIERNCRLDQDIQVTVTSWNSRQKTTLSTCYPASAADPSCSFTLVKPNLLLDEAQALAVSTYERISRQGRVLSCSMVGETAMTARSILQISGLSPPWDGSYAVDRLERQFSCRTGFIQRIMARTSLDEGVYVNVG